MVKPSRSTFDEAGLSRGAKARRSRVAAKPAEPFALVATPSSSWAVKRARGARRRRHVPRGCWADLTYGLAAVIAEHALANDVSDYMSFRAVCREWRRGAVDVPRPQGCLDRRFLPRQWIMLQEAAPPGPGHHRRRRFLNLTTGQCVQTELPELDGHLLAGATTEGLLALVDESTLAIRLLNPITRQLVHLPSLNTPRTAEIAESVSDDRRFDYQYSVSGIGLADDDDSTVALCLRSMLLVAQPGDDCWKVCGRAHYFHSAMSLAGRFYCVVTGRSVMVLGITAVKARPRLKAVVEVTFRVSGMHMDTVHLLESDDGKLLLLRSWRERSRDDDNAWIRKYEVYRVDHDARKTVPVHGLISGRAVFVGKVRLK